MSPQSLRQWNPVKVHWLAQQIAQDFWEDSSLFPSFAEDIFTSDISTCFFPPYMNHL